MSPPPIDLTDLMRRAQAGDQDAYRRLLTHARAAATGFLRRRLRDAHEVDDVCQNVLLKLHVSRHTYDPSQPFPPWFFALVRHALIDHLRRHKRRVERIELVEDGAEAFGESPEAEAALLGRAALAALTEEQRQTIAMIKVEGLTMEEASARAGTSVAAMKVRAHRAYKAIKVAFFAKDDELEDDREAS